MSYSLTTLWHERQRYLPAVLAVAFSAMLSTLQCGLLMGTFSIVSIPIDHAAAHVWVAYPKTVSVDIGRPIPESWRSRLDLPEIERTESYVQGFHYWHKPGGGAELCLIVGSRLDPQALGAVRQLTPELRARLSEPGAVVVDVADLDRLGLKKGVGETGEIGPDRVRVVGLVQGLKGLQGPYLFCSLDTARRLLHLPQDQTIYLLGRCKDPADAPSVVERLRRYQNLSAYTSTEFSLQSRWHWLRETGAGLGLACAAGLGLLVGAIVTSQTLYGATAASVREYAVLRAMGIPRWRMTGLVLLQSFWIGLGGVLFSLPFTLSLGRSTSGIGANCLLPTWLLAGVGGLTLVMALASGVTALRSLRLAEPAVLLR